MGKNVAVFVDVANIFYAAKAAGVDIDYVTLLKSATAGRDFVRAYAYTGLDPDNENQRNFHSFLARNSYKVVSKDIRKYGDGKVKANLDIELVVDLMKTARNLDVAIVVSGDGDFAPAIRAVQEMGVRVEVISFRGNTSSDLIEVADQFTDITQLARVEKGSSRSGRRVAGDEEDLSMTEVPDKQTEGTGPQRGRGRGRGRGRAGEAEPVAARASGGRGRAPVGEAEAAPLGLTVLPGEKLSKVAATPDIEPAASGAAAGEPGAAAGEPGAAAVEPGAFDEGEDAGGEEGRRRRRRRGGRGRGRGRGREEAGTALEVVGGEAADEGDDGDEELEIAAAPRGPRPTPFGSVWDSQLGVPSSGPSAPALGDDEDFDEPEIPEYLIAEQRRNQQQGRGGARGGRGGARGGRGSYSAAIDRERYGRGGGGGGINRYPDVSGRERSGGPPRSRPAEPAARGPRSDRPDRPDRSGGRSNEPWSEVPEDVQELLRAQLAQSPKAAAPIRTDRAAAVPTGEPAAVEAGQPEPEEAAPKRRTTRRKAPASASPDVGTAANGAEPATAEPASAAAEAVPKRRTTRRSTAAVASDAEATAESAEGTAEGAESTTPKRRTTRATSSRSTTTRTTRT
ncbi:MAG TPA: NYN domain-containing protein, partial [Candidatus Limnocylindrales bacterium]|nr:NYN domain-containing protein [Candidatus Limnocylindrales bacterium]